MYKFAEKAIDFNSDINSSKLNRLMDKAQNLLKASYGSSKIKAKEAFKDVMLLSSDEVNLLPDEDFALIYIDKDKNKIRRFPKPDVGNASVSGLYLLECAPSLPEEAAAIAAINLVKALDQNDEEYEIIPPDLEWAITRALRELYSENYTKAKKLKTNIYREPKNIEEIDADRKLNSEIEGLKKVKSTKSDDDFVFVTLKKGCKHRLFDVSTPELLKKQASYFENNLTKLPLEHRNTFAMKLRDKAAEYNIKLPGKVISKYASFEWSPLASECLFERINRLKNTTITYNDKTASYEAQLLGDPDQAKALTGYLKLASAVKKIPIDKYAHYLHMLDKLAGLDKAYGKGLDNPFESTYRQSSFIGKKHESKIASLNDTTSFAGKNISGKDILSIDFDELGNVIDKDTLDEIKVDPLGIFKELPIPYKSVIVDAITSKKGSK